MTKSLREKFETFLLQGCIPSYAPSAARELAELAEQHYASAQPAGLTRDSEKLAMQRAINAWDGELGTLTAFSKGYLACYFQGFLTGETSATAEDDEAGAWVIHFADPDMKPEMFTGHRARECAWRCFEQVSTGYNCYLFEKIAGPSAVTAPDDVKERMSAEKPSGEVEFEPGALRKLFAKFEDSWAGTVDDLVLALADEAEDYLATFKTQAREMPSERELRGFLWRELHIETTSPEELEDAYALLRAFPVQAEQPAKVEASERALMEFAKKRRAGLTHIFAVVDLLKEAITHFAPPHDETLRQLQRAVIEAVRVYRADKGSLLDVRCADDALAAYERGGKE